MTGDRFVDCRKCEGKRGWFDLDGKWIECGECDGRGFVEAEGDSDDD